MVPTYWIAFIFVLYNSPQSILRFRIKVSKRVPKIKQPESVCVCLYVHVCVCTQTCKESQDSEGVGGKHGQQRRRSHQPGH